MWMVIAGGCLFILGFGLLAKGFSSHGFFKDPQALLADLKQKSGSQEIQLSGLARIGICCWIAGACLLVMSINERDAEKLKQCQIACQKLGFGQAKWVTFCRCLQGPKHLDLFEISESK